MILEENWAVDPRRVRDFFIQQDGCIPTLSGFLMEGCAITLTEAEGTLLGKWPIRRSILRFEGTEDAVQAAYRRFFLAFLSAGG